MRLIPGLLLISRTLVGLVFVFSGFVKAVDPMGSAYKFSDYFIAFNMGFLEPLAVGLAVGLSALEFLIGVSLLLGFRFHPGAWLVSIFMVFFTLLTLILAITNPVSDCGCFGDALILTNWQTFFKNLALLPFVFVIFRYRKHHRERFPALPAWGGLGLMAIFILGIEVHAFRHLPVFDFRPYHTGTYIPAKMSIPEGAPQDEYQTFLYYEKAGEVKEFTEDNFPWEDTTWTFVDSKHILVSQGYEPPIHDFTMVDDNGNDLTQQVLADPGFTFLLVSTHLSRADEEAMRRADALYAWTTARGHTMLGMTASSDAEVENFRNTRGWSLPMVTTDEITLKTIVRSNPGLLLLREGTIMGKWHYRDFPAISQFENGIAPAVLNAHRRSKEKRTLGMFISIFLFLTLYLITMPVGGMKP